MTCETVRTAGRVHAWVAARDRFLMLDLEHAFLAASAATKDGGPGLPGGACKVGGDDVGGMPVRAAAGPLWWTRLFQLPECPAWASDPSHQTPSRPRCA